MSSEARAVFGNLAFRTGTASIRALLPGDVDGDLDVDLRDAFVLVESFESTLGEPKWNPYADFDENGVIDLSDATELSLNHEQHA